MAAGKFPVVTVRYASLADRSTYTDAKSLRRNSAFRNLAWPFGWLQASGADIRSGGDLTFRDCRHSRQLQIVGQVDGPELGVG
jgi:hypothetical protein